VRQTPSVRAVRRASSAMRTRQAPEVKTPMGRSLALPQDAQVLRTHPRLPFQNRPCSDEIVTTSERSTYTLPAGIEPLRCRFSGIGGTHLPASRRLTISVWLPLPREPIMMYGDSKGWGNRPVMSLINADNLALTDDPGMSAIPVCRREFKRHFHDRRWVESTVGSKQDPGAADVFRPCLRPFWTVGSAIANRNANRETFGPS
jgi:hypothetical protein